MIRIGFDIGGTNIKAGLFSGDMEMLSKKGAPFVKEGSYHNVITRMNELAGEMLTESRLCAQDVKAIGVAVAGAVDTVNGVVLKAHNLGFYNVPVKAEIQRLFPESQVCVINDAAAATWAEYKKGALRGCNNALLLTLGTGVGGGAIIDGRLWMGGNGNGFEPGHITLDINGAECTCGNRGCIETLCSAPWIEKKGGTDAKTVIDSAKNGDATSLEIFREYVENLSRAIASLTAVFDPEIIALGGGLSLAGEFLFGPLREKVLEKSFFKHAYKIVPAGLGNDAGIIGAVI